MIRLKRNKNKIKGCMSDKIFDVINTIVLTLILIVVAYPLIIAVSSSFSSGVALLQGKVILFPVDFHLEGYKVVTQNKQVLTGLYNSCYYTITGTVINMAVSILAAYPLSRKDFRPRTFINLLVAFTMLFGGGIIPQYILVKDLGMYNTRWAMLIPSAMSAWNMILIRNYFQNGIPESLFESARLDGCDDWRYLFNIALPVSLPTIAVVTLYYAVANWNAFFSAYMYLQSPHLRPLQVILRDILLMSQADDIAPTSGEEAQVPALFEVLKYSLVVVSSLPMALLYVSAQKYFTKGLMVGSVKG